MAACFEEQHSVAADMNSKQFQYTITLAQEGSFSRAADALGISQPSLSQYIKKIEKEIGLELFERTNGDVRLTDAGLVFVETGRKILNLEHQMESSFSDLTAYKAGSLIIGASPYRTVGMVAEIARVFKQIHPGMHLVVREGTTSELAEGMEHGEFDLCLTLLPIDSRIYDWEKIVEEELILAVPSTMPKLSTTEVPDRKYPAVSAKALNGQELVMLTEAQFMQKQLMNLALDYQLELRTAAVVKSLEAQIAMVRAGIGMAVMPSGIERFCNPGEVTFYSFIQPLPHRDLVVMWRKDRQLSQAALELKEVIRSIAW